MVTKSIIYYTDNRLDETIQRICIEELIQTAEKVPIWFILQKPLPWLHNIKPDANCVIVGEQEKRQHINLYRQILVGLSYCHTDYVFMAEHDVIYPQDYFHYEEACNGFNYGMHRLLLDNEGWWQWRRPSMSQLYCKMELLRAYLHRRIWRLKYLGYTNDILYSATEPGVTQEEGNEEVYFNRAISAPILDTQHGNNFYRRTSHQKSQDKKEYWGEYYVWQKKLFVGKGEIACQPI